MSLTGLDHVQLAGPPGCEDDARRFYAGAPVKWDDRYTGVRRFYTADPFGNRIEILAKTRPG